MHPNREDNHVAVAQQRPVQRQHGLNPDPRHEYSQADRHDRHNVDYLLQSNAGMQIHIADLEEPNPSCSKKYIETSKKLGTKAITTTMLMIYSRSTSIFPFGK